MLALSLTNTTFLSCRNNNNIKPLKVQNPNSVQKPVYNQQIRYFTSLIKVSCNFGDVAQKKLTKYNKKPK